MCAGRFFCGSKTGVFVDGGHVDPWKYSIHTDPSWLMILIVIPKSMDKLNLNFIQWFTQFHLRGLLYYIQLFDVVKNHILNQLGVITFPSNILVGGWATPLKNIWVRQLGWWIIPKISGKMPKSWQPFTTKQLMSDSMVGFQHGRSTRAPRWDCGNPPPTWTRRPACAPPGSARSARSPALGKGESHGVLTMVSMVKNIWTHGIQMILDMVYILVITWYNSSWWDSNGENVGFWWDIDSDSFIEALVTNH